MMCRSCGATVEADASHVGKTLQCKKCSAAVVIPSSETAPTVVAETKRSTLRGDQPRSRTVSAENEVPAVWRVGDVILDLYEVKEVFTGGGMGLVYRVHHNGWSLDLAVKSPRPEYFESEQQKKNFERECETWIHLGLHPHIVSCYYMRRLGGMPRVFAEYVEGGSLKDWIQTRKLYEGGPDKALERILDIAIQCAWGLHHAHEQGLIHQDVKPANVMMTTDGAAKVTDFGLAKARVAGVETPLDPRLAKWANEGLARSILVSVGGMTLAYCSPEQATLAKLTRKSDIWSWAVAVLEMFVGGVVWGSGPAAAEALEVYLKVGVGDNLMPRMPAAIADLLRRALQYDPVGRPKDMLAIAAMLDQAYKPAANDYVMRMAPDPAKLLADDLNNRAVSLLDLGRPSDAERVWARALAVDPRHPETTYNLGLMHWRSAQLTDQQLLKNLDEVRALRMDDCTTDYLVSLVHLERGDIHAAHALLESIQARAPAHAEFAEAVMAARRLAPGMEPRVCALEGHTADVLSVAISADGRWALSGSTVGKATTFEITKPVQFMFKYSRVGLESWKRFTEMEARLFMRGDAKVYVRLTNVAGAVVGSRSAAFLERTAQDLTIGTAAEGEPGQDVLHDGVRLALSAKEQLVQWQRNVSAWWLLNASWGSGAPPRNEAR